MDPPVAVRERVDVDEREGEAGRRDHGVEEAGGIRLEGEEPVHQVRQIFRAGRDVLGQGQAGVAIVLADEASLPAQSEVDEARVADHDALQTQELGEVEAGAAGLRFDQGAVAGQPGRSGQPERPEDRDRLREVVRRGALHEKPLLAVKNARSAPPGAKSASPRPRGVK